MKSFAIAILAAFAQAFYVPDSTFDLGF